MTAIRVRRATSADAGTIADIHLESRASAMPWLPRVHTDEETPAWVREVVLPGSDGLDHLYLLPDERRQRIGTRLLDVAKEASPDGLTLHVFARNTDARAFSACHGFQVVDTDDGSGNEEGVSDVTYRWRPVGRAGSSLWTASPTCATVVAMTVEPLVERGAGAWSARRRGTWCCVLRRVGLTDSPLDAPGRLTLVLPDLRDQ